MEIILRGGIFICCVINVAREEQAPPLPAVCVLTLVAAVCFVRFADSRGRLSLQSRESEHILLPFILCVLRVAEDVDPYIVCSNIDCRRGVCAVHGRSKPLPYRQRKHEHMILPIIFCIFIF